MKVALAVASAGLLFSVSIVPRSWTSTGESRPVVLAIQRDHRLHVLDAATLEPLGRIVVNNLAHRSGASLDGRTLFIAQAATADANGCCALFALDLTSGAMCRLLEQTMTLTTSADGRWLFTQRGNTEIDLFDARTLGRQPTIAAPGVYRLHPSPDGRWLVGLTSWAGPSLDVIDLDHWTLTDRLSISGGAGAWLGDRFYLYTPAGGGAALRTVTPRPATLGPSLSIDLPAGLANARLPAHPELLAGGGRLFVYEPLGWWLKRDPHSHGAAVSGGVFVIEAATGRVTARLAPAMDFAQLVADPDGRRLYGLDAGQPRGERPVRLLALDSTSGAVLAERALATDTWSIALATLPEALVPRGELRPAACERPEPTPFPAPAIPPTALPSRPASRTSLTESLKGRVAPSARAGRGTPPARTSTPTDRRLAHRRT